MYASPEIRVLTVQGTNRFLSTVWCAQAAAEPSVDFQIRGSNSGDCLFSFIFVEAQLPNSEAPQPLSNDGSVLPSQVCKIDMSPSEDCLSFSSTPHLEIDRVKSNKNKARHSSFFLSLFYWFQKYNFWKYLLSFYEFVKLSLFSHDSLQSTIRLSQFSIPATIHNFIWKQSCLDKFETLPNLAKKLELFRNIFLLTLRCEGGDGS